MSGIGRCARVAVLSSESEWTGHGLVGYAVGLLK